MYCRVPGRRTPASSLRRRMPKQTGNSHPSSGATKSTPRACIQEGQVVNRVVGHLLAVPVAAVARHDAVTEDDTDGVDRADDRDSVVGVRGGYRVVVGVEPDQGERVDAPLLDPGGHERLAGQGEQRGPLLLQQVRLDRGLAPEPPAEVRTAACLEVGVERLQAAAHGGDRDQEVAAGVPDQGLDVPLLIGPSHEAEV